MSRFADFLLIAAISAVVFLGCKKERSFRGANPGDEIVFGGTAGSVSGFRSSKTKGGDGDSSVAGVLAGTGLDASEMESCGSYDSDADETYFFDWEDFEGGEACESSVSCGSGISEAYSENRANGVSSFGGSDAGNGLFGVSENDVQTKTDYSGHKENVGGKDYERIDWVVGDKVKIFADGVAPPKTECVYEVSSHATVSGIRSSGRLRPFNESDGHGLMWGSGNADFYAFYPGNSPAKVSASNTPSNFDITVKLPEMHNYTTIVSSVSHIKIIPDMERAAMLAVSRRVSPTSSVQLDFFPLVTTFKITIGNPSTTDNIRINKVSIGYTPLVPTPNPMSGDYTVRYNKTSGSTLSSHLQLMPVNGASVGAPSFNSSMDLSSLPIGPVILTKNNGKTLSVTLFAVPLSHKGLQLKINVTQGGNTEDRILYLEKKQSNPYAQAKQLEFEAYKKYDINVGVGKKWRYELSSTDLSAPYSGGTLSGWVRSYKTDGSTTKPASWWVEGYSETGATGPFTTTKPAWLMGITPHGNGVASPLSVDHTTVSVSAQSHITSPNARTIALRGKSEVGSQSEPIDLSRVPIGTSPNHLFSIDDGASASTYASNSMNTANCYVVTCPGWYKIPVVYGNALKNGNDNIAAYKPSGSGNNFLTDFIRHDGNAITKPWIKDNGINLNNGVAELVWQDFPFLLQDIKFDKTNKDYISFYISKATIHEGNAVIALKDNNGTIVWSWHIWVCGSNDLRSIKVKNNKAKAPTSKPGRDNFDFLSENLGSCYDSGESFTYPAGNIWVKISNGRKTEVIKITRVAGPSFTTSSKYNHNFYQWGRKDPMLPSDGTAFNQNKFWFDKDGTSNNNFPFANWVSDGSVPSANAEIANTIKNPQTFNTFSYMDNLYYNLWDANCNETGDDNDIDITKAGFEPVTKSVYDPCPPGFCLPPDGAFTGFTISGNNSGNPSELNVSGPFSEGYHFRTVLKGEPDAAIDPTIFFPASGFRFSYVGVLQHVGGYGYHWSSVPYNTSNGCGMNIGSGYMFPMYSYIRSYGYAVRPVKE